MGNVSNERTAGVSLVEDELSILRSFEGNEGKTLLY